MVEVVRTRFLSGIRSQSTYRVFPDDEHEKIVSAVEAVPDRIFTDGKKGVEIRKFDSVISDELPDYAHEHDSETGRNSACKLWDNEGFDHSVDLYNPEKRIAIEIEKSERKRVSDDILKFIKGGKTQRANRKKVEFGCLVVPTNYRGSGDLFGASMRNLEFIRSVLFVEDIAILGYVDPRWG
jgi:hypothetical protein